MSKASTSEIMGSATTGHAIYSKLDVGDDPQIRVLKLLQQPNPSDRSSPLLCELDVVPLSSCGSFDAISYVWGDDNERATIVVNGRELSITASLYLALRQWRLLHDQEEIVRVWADGACINQEDKGEVSSQVALMGTIYREAQCVMVWLGEEGDDSSLALSMMARWSKVYNDRKKQKPSIPEDAGIFQEIPGPTDPRGWTAVEKLFERPWWWRVWTTQEISVCKHAVLVCGDAWTPYRNLVHAFLIWVDLDMSQRFARNFSSLHTTIGTMVTAVTSNWPESKTAYYQMLSPQDPPLEILKLFFKLKCTDPRDRVYGALGMFGNPPSLDIDYGKSVSQVYLDFTHSMISETQQLDILLYAGLKSSSGAQRPSWVANLDAGKAALNCAAIIPEHYDACAGKTATLKFSEDLQVLSTTGISVDPIVSVHDRTLLGIHAMNFLFSNFEVLYRPDVSKSTLEAFFRLIQKDRNDTLAWRKMPDHDYNEEKEVSDDQEKMANHDETFVDCSREFILYMLYEITRGWFLDEIQNPEISRLEQSPGSILHKIIGLKDDHLGLAGFLTELFYPDENTRPRISFTSWEQDRSSQSHYFPSKLKALWGFSLFRTQGGYLGIGPEVLDKSKGDFVCVLLGCRVPVVLRPCVNTRGYYLVGDAYVQGLMDGEAVRMCDEGQLSTEIFDIL